MEKLSYWERDYASRLEKYIADEHYSGALYAALARRCEGRQAAMLRAMSADEARHLRAMQMEYYLLTGDSLRCADADVAGDSCELLRGAYAGEAEAAEGYAREARLCADEELKKLYMAQSADEWRHRANVKKILGSALGLE